MQFKPGELYETNCKEGCIIKIIEQESDFVEIDIIEKNPCLCCTYIFECFNIKSTFAYELKPVGNLKLSRILYGG